MSRYDYSKPFRVRVTKDCRENPEEKLDGQFGTCLGQYEIPEDNGAPNLDKKMPEDLDPQSDEAAFGYSPLIKTEGGKYIWGIECWWVSGKLLEEPLEKLQAATDTHVKQINQRAGLEAELK